MGIIEKFAEQKRSAAFARLASWEHPKSGKGKSRKPVDGLLSLRVAAKGEGDVASVLRDYEGCWRVYDNTQFPVKLVATLPSLDQAKDVAWKLAMDGWVKRGCRGMDEKKQRPQRVGAGE